MSTPTTQQGLREAAHKAMDAYLDAGGTDDFIIMSRKDLNRNFALAVEQTLNDCLPEKKPHDLDQGVPRYANDGKDMWGNHYADILNSGTDGHNNCIDQIQANFKRRIG